MIVVWRVTERCNLRCPFCAWDRSLAGVRREIDARRVERFARLLGAWSAWRGERVLLSWLGGEPLLWKPVFGLSHRLHAECGLEIGATTNGTALVHARVRERIRADFTELTVSVDGPADFHEPLRGWPRGWAKLRAAVRDLSSADRLLLRANVVLMRQNLPLFADLCEELASWGIREITFNQLGGRDRPEYFPVHRLRPQDTAQLAELVPGLRARLAAVGVRLCGGSDYLRRISASAHDEHLAIGNCDTAQPADAVNPSPACGRGAGERADPERFLFIDERGLAAPCSFSLAECGIPVDELISVARLEALPTRFAALRRQRRPAACDDCPSTQVFAKFAG